MNAHWFLQTNCTLHNKTKLPCLWLWLLVFSSMWDRFSITLLELILIINVLTWYYLQDFYSRGSQFETQTGYWMSCRRFLVSSVCPANTVISDHTPLSPHLYLLANHIFQSHPTFRSYRNKNIALPVFRSQPLVLSSKHGDSFWSRIQDGLLFKAECRTVHNRCWLFSIRAD